jgi:hypothetical protein
MRTEESQRPTLRLVGDGQRKNGSVFDSFGHTNQGSTTSPRTPSQVLLEYLNSLDYEIETLESRYLEVCATLNIVMARLVELGLIGANIPTTEEEESK